MKNLSKIKDILAPILPTVATALGGPLAGVAVNALKKKIFPDVLDASDDQLVDHILSAAPGDLIVLKEMEFQFKRDIQELGVDLARIDADDRNSARARQVSMKDWTPTLLGLVIILGFFGLLGWIMNYGLPVQGGEVMMIMVGALAAMTTQVGNYFFGSSAGSASKNQIIADLKGALE